jgi:hypothetical protein
MLISQSENPTETLILELTGSGRIFTALELTSLSRNATYTCIATNFEVMWVDELSVGPPTLTWRHDFGSGTIRDLRLQVMNGPTSGKSTRRRDDTSLTFRAYLTVVAKFYIGHGI